MHATIGREDPTCMSAIDFERAVQRVVKGSGSQDEVRTRIAEAFSTSPEIQSVLEKGIGLWGVTLKPYSGAPHHHILCSR